MNRTSRLLGGVLVVLVILATAPSAALATDPDTVESPVGPVFVSQPVVPLITPAVRDLPDWKPDQDLFGLETKRREDYGFIPTLYPITPKVDPLLYLQTPQRASQTDGFGTLIHNYAGETSSLSPPDTVGDVGPNHFVQAVNASGSTVAVFDKATGATLKSFTMQSLTTASPCRSGLGDGQVLYDRAADRWLISELPNSGGNVCVYVSTTSDPTGTYYAYSFAVENSTTDYPKYGIWPQNGNGGSYLMSANAGSGGNRDLFALDRAKMLSGQAATFQKFSVPNLPNSGFQLVLPSTMQGPTPPPDGEPAIFMRPHDDEAQEGATTPSFDLMDMWKLTVDWATPANSRLTQLTALHIGDYDMTLCGLGGIWNCMPQPNTSQKIDPIREPLHFPLQYRNFGDRQTLVGTFPEDVDGTDHAALRWFELRKTGAGNWTLYQEGVVGGESGVHRSVASIAMDGSGNIAMGYTRTGTSTPYYPSIYYKGRLSTDALGTMPQGENVIIDATNSNTDNERWGDYSGIGIDPADDCTFWYTTEYGGQGNTRIAAFKFDACGCAGGPSAPTASAAAPQSNQIDVTWSDSSSSSAAQYLIFRSTTAGGPYTQIGTKQDSSPGVANGASYRYHDNSVSGGTRYYYVIKANDGGACTSGVSNEANALATGVCRLGPNFAGLKAVSNPNQSTCTLALSWDPATSNCSGVVTYQVYRSATAGFTPSDANRIAAGVAATSFNDTSGLANNASYYYVVRAVDSADGIEDSNVVQKSGSPSGTINSTNWTDTFEGAQSGGGFDLAGWSHAILTGATDWAWSTAQKHDGTHAWFAVDSAFTSDKVLVSPVINVGAPTTLSFFHTYRFQGSTTACGDGGTLEYTTDAGAHWTVLPESDFTAGGFTGTVTAQGNPLFGSRAWCGDTLGPMTQVVVNLGGDANLVNKSIQMRWREGDNNGISSTGWYVDTVTVNNNQTVNACATGATCALPAVTSGLVLPSKTTLSWAPTQGAANYDVVRGSVSPLLATGGFATATEGCSASHLTGTSLTDAHVPVTGDATWFLVRADNACGAGTYDERSSSQQHFRDPGIKASANACP